MPILASIISNLFEAVVLAAAAAIGVVCGHKFRDHKDAQKAARPADQKDKT